MFEWNGSEVTELIKNSIIEEAVYNKTIYWRVIHNEKEQYCMVRSMSNGILPCLIDEIKPIFDLEKIGTHWTKYNNKKLLLLKVNVNVTGSIIYDLHLDIFPFNEKLCHEVQKIFAFRNLLGMSKSYETSIILRKINKYIVPISYYEPNMEPSSEGKIPNTVLDKWFKNISIEEVVKNMLKIKDLKEIANILHAFRSKLEKVVKRCDNSSITFVDEIISRIGSCLQHILN